MQSRDRVPRVLILALLVGALMVPMATSAQTPTCADYSTTAAAQFALDINPNLAPSLDPDGNGIACDDAAGTAPTPSSTELQLPAGTTPAPSQPQATADVVDGQPTQPGTTTQTQPTAGTLDGRIGGSRASIEATYGPPVQETPSQSNPNATGVAYAGSGAIADLYVVYITDQAIIIWLTPAQPWTSDEASAVLNAFVPADVTTLPQPEVLADGSLLLPITSPMLAGGITQDAMTTTGIPGVPGDMYLLLTIDGSQMIVDVEIGVGNGDNIRSDINSGQTTTPTTAATGTTTFLQQARAEVDQYQAEIVELRTILGKETFSEADTARLSEIVAGWMAIDTTPIAAPPEHAAIAQQLTTIHADLSTVGSIIFSVISTGDTSRIQEAADTLNRAESSLQTLDQQLTALGV